MGNDTPLRNSILLVASFIAVLWSLKLIEFLTASDLYQWGIFPRSAGGLAGLLTAPLIHGSWEHLVGNTLPTLLLGVMLVYGYPKSRWWALSGIWLMSGIGVWLFARESYHFGASGLTHGVFFYLFVGGILRRDRRSAAILMVAFYMYGGMLLSIFPNDPAISFESHLSGALAGASCACFFRDWDPRPARKRYSWEERQGRICVEEEEDPVIGNQWRTDPD